MTDNSMYFDVIIIGGGPGGLSAAQWCADLGMKAIVLEKEAEFGGQLLWTFNSINNYLGTKQTTGRELRDRFVEHVESTGLIERMCGVEIASVNLANKTVCLTDGKQFLSKAIIIATGVRRRKLGVPGEKEFAGRGVLESGAKSLNSIVGKTVAIVGGGDAALENALILSKTAEKVIIIHRRGQFSARPDFIERVSTQTKIASIYNSTIIEIFGNTTVTAIELQNTASSQRSQISVDAVLIRIGVVPNTELFHGQIPFTGPEYIGIDTYSATTVPGIYAIGDVASPLSPTIANAVGQGSAAAKAILKIVE